MNELFIIMKQGNVLYFFFSLSLLWSGSPELLECFRISTSENGSESSVDWQQWRDYHLLHPTDNVEDIIRYWRHGSVSLFQLFHSSIALQHCETFIKFLQLLYLWLHTLREFYLYIFPFFLPNLSEIFDDFSIHHDHLVPFKGPFVSFSVFWHSKVFFPEVPLIFWFKETSCSVITDFQGFCLKRSWVRYRIGCSILHCIPITRVLLIEL